MIVKKLFILVSVFLLSASMYAQTGWGLQGGINLSTLRVNSPDYSTSYQPGFYGGGFVRHVLSPAISVQGEINYGTEGARTKSTIVPGDGGHIRIGYLQVPLLLQVNTPGGFYIEAGPQLSYVLSFKEEWNEDTYNTREQNKRAELRAPFGVGYHFPGALNGWSVRTRFAFSFSRINKESSIPGRDLRGQVGSIGLQYNFSANK